VNQVCNEHDKATPVHFAVLAQNIESVQILLKKGANPNARDSAGNNSMHFAVMVENLPIVKLLDDFGCDATVKNDDGLCAIEVAQEEGDKEILLHFMSL
jgi:ankyrin repeat protein